MQYYWKSCLRGRRNWALKVLFQTCNLKKSNYTHINSSVITKHVNIYAIWICFFKVGAACYRSKCWGKPFGVGDSLRKDTRENEQICLSPCLLAVIRITHRAPTWRLCSLLCKRYIYFAAAFVYKTILSIKLLFTYSITKFDGIVYRILPQTHL